MQVSVDTSMDEKKNPVAPETEENVARSRLWTDIGNVDIAHDTQGNECIIKTKTALLACLDSLFRK